MFDIYSLSKIEKLVLLLCYTPTKVNTGKTQKFQFFKKIIDNTLILYTQVSNYSNVIYVKRDSEIFISSKPCTLIATIMIVHIS